jgi:exosortase family protein XrtF
LNNATNTSLLQLYQEYKPAILFLLRFLGIYILGNVVYGMWIVSFGHLPDPFTQLVTANSSWLLNLIGFKASTFMSGLYPSVSLQLDGTTVVNVYEGCNAINVAILFVAFLFAYKGSVKRTVLFSVIGLATIYVFNLFRVAGLFLVAKYFPDQLYLMHKFVFTGVLYAFIFFLWFLWVKKYASGGQ